MGFDESKTTFKVVLNGNLIEGKTNSEIYLNTIREIGLEKLYNECSDLRVGKYEYPVIVKEEPVGTHYDQVGEYFIPSPRRGPFRQDMLKLIKERLGLDIVIDDKR